MAQIVTDILAALNDWHSGHKGCPVKVLLPEERYIAYLLHGHQPRCPPDDFCVVEGDPPTIQFRGLVVVRTKGRIIKFK